MITKTKKNSYSNGQRICEQVITYTKSEDLQMLGNLYCRLSSIENQLLSDNSNNNTAFNEEKKRVLDEIELYKKYIDGYGGDVIEST